MGTKSGSSYAHELFESIQRHFYELLRIRKITFNLLLERLLSEGWLKPNYKCVSACEALAIFLYISGNGVTVSAAADRFRRPPEAISEQFDRALKALLQLASFVVGRSCNNPHFTIVDSPRFNPWFLNCIGAMNGVEIQAESRDITTLAVMNCLAAVDFDLLFTFFNTGCQGPAHDEQVLANVINNLDNKFPPMRRCEYYLVDSRFPNADGFLAAFKGVQYHFDPDSSPPRNPREFFNCRHSDLRAVIERSVGMLKERFRILNRLPSEQQEFHSGIPVACAAVHNFIRMNDPIDPRFQVEAPFSGGAPRGECCGLLFL